MAILPKLERRTVIDKEEDRKSSRRNRKEEWKEKRRPQTLPRPLSRRTGQPLIYPPPRNTGVVGKVTKDAAPRRGIEDPIAAIP
jgi:hypothetical protein